MTARAPALLFALAACGGPAPARPAGREAPPAAPVTDRDPDPDPDRQPDAYRPPDPDADPDRDRIAGSCDLCPAEPETWNAILDEDGCPDSSGTSHAVIEDPTNHFAVPTLEVLFAIGATSATVPAEQLSALAREIQERQVEAIECIGQAAPEEGRPAVLAGRRAKVVCDQLRAAGVKVRLTPRSAGAGAIRQEGTDRAPVARVVVQVVRAANVQIWRWNRTLLVRATPARRLEYPKPLDPACTTGRP